MTNSPPSSEHYRPRIGQAAVAGLLITCQCYVCRRYRAYIASELLMIYHPDTFLEDLFGGRCPRCGSRHNWRVKQRYPTNDDVGTLTIRRHQGYRKVHMWKDELYSAPEKPKPVE
jgi:hypothetical protein